MPVIKLFNYTIIHKASHIIFYKTDWDFDKCHTILLLTWHKAIDTYSGSFHVLHFRIHQTSLLWLLVRDKNISKAQSIQIRNNSKKKKINK